MSFPLHFHDSPELFWIESGTGIHQRGSLNHEEILHPGSCLLVPPAFAHGFTTRSGNGFVLLNVSFRANLLPGIHSLVPDWPWGDRDDPALITLGSAAIARLGAWLPELRPSVHPLAVQAFLLEAVRLACTSHDDRLQGLPGPVATVLADILAGENIPLWLDAASLASHSGWSIEHLNRTVRRTTGKTTTELLNHLRLELSERLLRLDSAPIATIAMRSGFANISHFYHLFHQAYGHTPLAHRKRSLCSRE